MQYVDQNSGYDEYGFAADAALSERSAFIRRVYGHVFGAILAFIGLSYVFVELTTVGEDLMILVGRSSFWIILIPFMLVSWLANKWAHAGVSQTTQYLGLGIYVVAEALIFAPILWLIANHMGDHIIPTAAGLTLLITGGLTAVVFLTKSDFSFMRNFLWTATIGLFAVAVIGSFAGFSGGLLMIGAFVLVFCGWILYDTSNIMHHYPTNMHVGAALALFSSIATLFWYILQFVALSDD